MMDSMERLRLGGLALALLLVMMGCSGEEDDAPGDPALSAVAPFAVDVGELRRRFEAADSDVLDELFGTCGGLSIEEDPARLMIIATGTGADAERLQARFAEVLDVPTTQVVVDLVSPDSTCGDTDDVSSDP